MVGRSDPPACPDCHCRRSHQAGRGRGTLGPGERAGYGRRVIGPTSLTTRGHIDLARVASALCR
ncbi:putative leader peptide [Pseudonocardia endophytica]|uniref:putative leader peptide n=1 Tax=Pseudonocardia endophytica TaxID=401976 RepID=UPI003C769935